MNIAISEIKYLLLSGLQESSAKDHWDSGKLLKDWSWDLCFRCWVERLIKGLALKGADVNELEELD